MGECDVQNAAGAARKPQPEGTGSRPQPKATGSEACRQWQREEFGGAGPPRKHQTEHDQPRLPTGPVTCPRSIPTRKGSAVPAHRTRTASIRKNRSAGATTRARARIRTWPIFPAAAANRMRITPTTRLEKAECDRGSLLLGSQAER